MALIIHAPVGNNKNVFKALIAAEYVGVKIELTPSFQMGVTNTTPEFLKLNPLGKVQQTSFCSLLYIYICFPAVAKSKMLLLMHACM
jgi:hypothetical protein